MLPPAIPIILTQVNRERERDNITTTAFWNKSSAKWNDAEGNSIAIVQLRLVSSMYCSMLSW